MSSDSTVLPAQPPFLVCHLAEKAWGAGLSSGPQGAVLQNLWVVGALPHLKPVANVCSLSPLLSFSASPPRSLIINNGNPSCPTLDTLQSRGTSLISHGPSQKAGMEQNEMFPLSLPPPTV